MRKTGFRAKIKKKTDLIGSLITRLKKEKFSQKIQYPADYSLPVIAEADVVVVGGGISGIASALAAARCGAKTILIEQQGVLGGLATLGFIPPISNQFFDAKGSQITKGLADEIMALLAQSGAIVEAWRDWKIPKYPFDIEKFKLVIYRLLAQAGVEIMLNTLFSETIVEGDKINFIVVENESKRGAIKAKVFIDSSGAATVALCAGAPCRVNADLSPDSDSAKQAVSALLKKIGWINRTEKTASLQFAVSNLDTEKFYNYILENSGSFAAYDRGELKEDIELFKYLWNGKGILYIPHTRNFEKEIKKAEAEHFFQQDLGRYKSIGQCGVSIDGLRSNGIFTVTANKIAIDPFFAEDITYALIKGQEVCFEIWRFFKKYIPGFEDSVLTAVAPLLGIRRAAQVIGEKVMTVEERERELAYDDVIGMYSRKTLNAREIPYFCLVPQKIKNLIIGSGKSVSTDDHAMFRTKPHCLIIGQAAGCAAALCAKSGFSIPELNIKILQKTLLQQDVYLGDNERLRNLGLL